MQVTDEQVYGTKAPVIHSGLPNKFLVGETDKQSKKNQKKKKWNFSTYLYLFLWPASIFFLLQRKELFF